MLCCVCFDSIVYCGCCVVCCFRFGMVRGVCCLWCCVAVCFVLFRLVCVVVRCGVVLVCVCVLVCWFGVWCDVLFVVFIVM